MNSLVKFNEMSEKFKNVAKMYIVYISEAHPVDEWYIPTSLKPVNQHKEPVLSITIHEYRLY